MKTNETFSVRRLWLLLRSDAVDTYRSLLMVSGTLAAFILAAETFIRSAQGVGGGFYLTWFGGMLFTWGIIASSRSFRQLHDNTRNEAYLLLPASAVEKTLARLLALTIGFVGYLLILTCLISVMVETLSLLLSGERNAFFSPFDPSVWKLIPAYIILQSPYFLGAAWFRKTHFVKTTLAIILILAGLVVFSLITFRIAFSLHPKDLGQVLHFVFDTAYPSHEGVIDVILAGVGVLLPIACWCMAWMRIRETQVSDGVP